MHIAELALIAVSLSMDAFAAAVTMGLSMRRFSMKEPLIVGLYFGFFQAAMPIVGYFAAAVFADGIAAVDHWVAFALLAFIGGKMIVGSIGNDKAPAANDFRPTPKNMLAPAFATSIDAMAVGISFAILRTPIAPAACFIGGVTCVLSVFGVHVGRVFGARLRGNAELFGGMVLIAIGGKILLEHLGVIAL